MVKNIRIGNKILIFFDDNTCLNEVLPNEETYEKIQKLNTKKEIYKLFNTKYSNAVDKWICYEEKIKTSHLLNYNDGSVFWYDISSLSLPFELVDRIIEAEKKEDKIKLLSYKNFWTLMSLNPNEECRRDLFTFLCKYGMTISKSGFFVGYRNVESTNEKGVYTDYYTKSFRIQIGEMVVMKRNECDCRNDVSCSNGLHVSGKGWLKKYYCGDTGLAVLVNPADVVAVPQVEDNYGKLRTCAYLPMEIIHYDNNDDVIPLNIEDGFDCSYITKVIYEGIMGTEKDSLYKIKIPNIEVLNQESIQNTLLDIAKDCIIHRQF